MDGWPSLFTHRALEQLNRGDKTLADITRFKIATDMIQANMTMTDVVGEVIAEGIIDSSDAVIEGGSAQRSYHIKATAEPGATYGNIGLFDEEGNMFLICASTRGPGVVPDSGKIDLSAVAVAHRAPPCAYEETRVDTIKDGVAALPVAKDSYGTQIVRIPGLRESVLAFSSGDAWAFVGYEIIMNSSVIAMPTPKCLRVRKIDTPWLTPSMGIGDTLLQVIGKGVRMMTGYRTENDTVLIEFDKALGPECVGERVMIHRTRPSLSEIKLPAEYELPPASANVLGGIKLGAGFTIDDENRVSVKPQRVDRISVKQIDGLADIAKTGSWVDIKDPPKEKKFEPPKHRPIPTATKDKAGVVKIGKGLFIDEDGNLEVTAVPLDASKVQLLQTASHYLNGTVIPERVIYVIAALQPWRITAQDIYLSFLEPWLNSADLNIALSLYENNKSRLVGRATFVKGQRRAAVMLDKEIEMARGDRLAFTLQRTSSELLNRMGVSLDGMTIALQSRTTK